MFFQKLVQQHCIYLIVSHGVRFTVSIPSHEVRIYLLNVLGHKSKVGNALRVNLVLVPKRNWFEREDRFAGLVHRFDVILEALRGYYCTKVTIGQDQRSDLSGSCTET